MKRSTLLLLSLSLIAVPILACSVPQVATPIPAAPTPEPPVATPELPTPTLEPPAATPEPPTSTPELPATTTEPEPTSTRIQFEPGAMSATVTGHIGQNDIHHYVLRALAGQTMEVIITSPNNDVLLTVYGADGVVLKRHAVGDPEWRGELPSTQDYFINAVSVGEETDYELAVTIGALEPEPTRIQFEPGATSATIEGKLEQPGASDRYVLRALRGQRMVVHVTSAEWAVDIEVEGEDGSFWSVPFVESTLTIEELPATQDYIITLTTAATAGTTDYTMEVSIPPP